ncbi:MAG: hypothetical protein AB7G37_06260 [Solirubrobacteraceae bacterium]
MRATRFLSVVLTLTTVLTLAACGGDDATSDARLTRADYELLVKQHREQEALLKREPTTLEGVKKLGRAMERMCDEYGDAGPVLRAAAPSCDASVSSLASMMEFSELAESCGEDDPECLDEALEGFVGTFGGFVRAFEEGNGQVAALDLSPDCRAALSAPKEAVALFVEIRDSGRALLSADDGDLEKAGARFDAALNALADSDPALVDTDPAPCEKDIEAD